jgi:hypothetical protein
LITLFGYIKYTPSPPIIYRGVFLTPYLLIPPYTPPSLPVGVSPLPSFPLFSPIWGDNPLNDVWTENFYKKFLGKNPPIYGVYIFIYKCML